MNLLNRYDCIVSLSLSLLSLCVTNEATEEQRRWSKIRLQPL